MNEDHREILDFSQPYKCNVCREINEKAQIIRKNYIAFLESVIKEDEENLDWWVMDFVSRNTLASPLFRNCCILAVARDHLAEGKPICVKVARGGLEKALKRLIDNQGAGGSGVVKVLRVGGIPPLRGLFKGPARFLFSCWRLLLLWLSSKIIRNESPLTTDKPLTLFDIFVLSDSFRDGKFFDRYYGDLLDSIDGNEKQSVFYLPTCHGVRISRYLNLFRDLRNPERSFLAKEDFLRLSDYLSAFLYPIRVLRMKPCNASFDGIDVSPLIAEEMRKSMFSFSSLLGLLNYRFCRRLRDKKVMIKRFVNWFENQSIDHGLNRGFRDFFPESEHLGYQGFPLSDNFLGLYPTVQEERCRVIPKKIAVAGKGFLEEAKKFNNNLDVVVAPSLRYGSIWADGTTQNTRYGKIETEKRKLLAAMPIFLEESVFYLKMLESIMGEIERSWDFFVKLHPTMNIEQVQKNYGGQVPEVFQFVSGNFGDWLDRSDLLLGGSSSTTLETIARGKPVVVIASPFDLTQNFIPESVPGEIWKFCYCREELKATLDYFHDLDERVLERFNDIGAVVRENFFEPVTSEGKKALLGVRG